MGWTDPRGDARGTGRARLFLSFLVFVALLVAGPIAAASAAGPSFALKPAGSKAGTPYFTFDARPGADLHGAIRVKNEGDRAGVVRLYGVDARTGQTTGAVYRERTDSRKDVGAWLSISAHSLHLAAGKSRVVDFRVRIPAAVRPGQHLGGIVAENATLKKAGSEKAGRGTFRVDIRDLSILAVQVNLPGKPLEDLRLTTVKAGHAEGFQSILIGIGNTGNQLVKGTGTIVLSGADGEKLKRGHFKVDTFVPRTSIEYPFAVPGQALPAGRYHAEVTVRYGHGRVARLSKGFEISDKRMEQVFGSDSRPPAATGSSDHLPLLLGILAALLLLGALAGWVVWRRRRPGEAPLLPVYVTAVHMPNGDGHERIELFQWQNPNTLETGQATAEQVVAWIEAGGDLRVRDLAGGEFRIGVIAADPPYLRAYADGAWTDSLLSMPRY